MGMLRAMKVGLWLVRNVPEWLLRPLPVFFGVLFYLGYGTRRRIIIANQRQVWEILVQMQNATAKHMLQNLPSPPRRKRLSHKHLGLN